MHESQSGNPDPRERDSFQKIKRVVEQSDSGAGKLFDLAIQSLIILSIISYSIETIDGLSEQTRKILWIVELVVIIIFTGEYILRFVVADHKRQFVFSFFSIIDLLSILPFYLMLGDFRSLRALRLLRLFRILKLARYSEAAKRFHRAIILAKEEFVLFFAVTLIVFFLAAAGINHFEGDAQPEQFGSVFSSMWWAVVTLTTVGYGDAYPITVGGKIFTGVLLVLAISLVAVPPGILTSALNEARIEVREEHRHDAE